MRLTLRNVYVFSRPIYCLFGCEALTLDKSLFYTSDASVDFRIIQTLNVMRKYHSAPCLLSQIDRSLSSSTHRWEISTSIGYPSALSSSHTRAPQQIISNLTELEQVFACLKWVGCPNYSDTT